MPRKPNHSQPDVSSGARAPKVTARSRRAAAAPAESPAMPESAALPETDQDAVARLAYSYWAARGYKGGSPEEDWLRAEEEIRSGQHAVAAHA